MNYQESLDYIKSLTPTLERPTMARIKLYFEELGNPQDEIASFHVGGTNGKGSTTTFIASMLQACGKRVGKFTGPHLIRFNERLVVDGLDIDDRQFAAVASVVHRQSLAFAAAHPDFGSLSWFEFLTAMAVQYFRQEKVDYAVFEVGLGGRFDATNALNNILVTTITNVDLDHMQLLGKTVEAIAGEKAGIIKACAPLVTAAGGGALQVIEAKATGEGVPLAIVDVKGGELSIAGKNAGREFSAKLDERLAFLQNYQDMLLGGESGAISTRGAYQRENALVALTAFALSPLFDEQLKLRGADALAEKLALGLANSYWPGRFEVMKAAGLILDGAHNPAGARALRQSLEKMFAGAHFVFVFASFENKDLRSVLVEMTRPGDHLFCPDMSGERAFHKFADIKKICDELLVECTDCQDFARAAAAALLLVSTENVENEVYGPLVVVAGSFAVIREAKVTLSLM